MEGLYGLLVVDDCELADRPQGKRLFDILRAGDTLVVRWVDRLGRNYGFSLLFATSDPRAA
jgi:DNA invertase Pin-like site-specific DNA recombinase